MFKKVWLIIGLIIGTILIIMIMKNIKLNFESGDYFYDWPCGKRLRNCYYSECK